MRLLRIVTPGRRFVTKSVQHVRTSCCWCATRLSTGYALRAGSTRQTQSLRLLNLNAFLRLHVERIKLLDIQPLQEHVALGKINRPFRAPG